MRACPFIFITCAIVVTAQSSFASTNLGYTLTTNRPLLEGETLVSSGGVFALGFFSPNNSSSKRYVGIWYHNISSRDVVWVANARNPVLGLAGSLTLALSGRLLIIDRNTTVIWMAPPPPTATVAATNPTAQLFDTGNLIVTDDVHSNSYIWQSFDYASNTALPGMFIGRDLRTGFSWNITSWTSSTDPSPGPYTLSIQLSGVPQLMITQNQIVFWRGGPWVDNGFTGLPQVHTYQTVGMAFVSTREMVGYNSVLKRDVKLRLVLNPNGTAQPLSWLDDPGQWRSFWHMPMDECDLFLPCGPFSVCNANEIPHCSCLTGFRPKNSAQWPLRNVSDGCVRNTTLDCRNGTGSSDGFSTVSGVKLPDTSAAVADGGLGLEECRVRCLTNCSCTAYSLSNVSNGGSGCIIWNGELNDMRLYVNGGQDLYVRVAAIDLGTDSSSQSDHRGEKTTKTVVPIIGSLLVAGFISISCVIAHRKNIRNVICRKDENKKMLLDWKMRYNIIVGIARGLLYLHQDSSIRVIHRDLKASNILLNKEMVSKISDFGLARILGEDDVKSETKIVVGTYGYMSPEYMMEGVFSIKSDVFSFGVIILEIISNKRNKVFSTSQANNHLIELTWSLWNEGRPLELVDESISNSFSIAEVLRCIQVGLLCVQECADDRPLMSSVIMMLDGDKDVLPEPKHPGFVARRHSFEGDDHSTSIKRESAASINEVSLTMPVGR